MADLNFTNDELSEMECLQIRGGAGAGGDGIMAQGECTNGVAGCGGNIDRSKHCKEDVYDESFEDSIVNLIDRSFQEVTL